MVRPPLAVPAPAPMPSNAPAVPLFLTGRARPTPTSTAGRRCSRRVGDVCRALDGLPLASSSPPPGCGTLTVEDLADRLDPRFELLTHGRRERRRPPPHPWAVVDWSFDLLTPEEQRLFLRLSVFAASFDIAAAEAVVADEELPVGRVADLLAGLADRSMLTRPGHAGVSRYRMLETLRAYAAARLPAAEVDRLRHRHAALVVDVAERADAGLYGPDEPAWARRLETWLDDLRAAWGWARDASQVDLAVRLAAALTRYGYWRMRPDILAWGAWVVAAVPAHPRLAVAFAAAAHAAWIDGRLDQARELAQRGVAIAGGPRPRLRPPHWRRSATPRCSAATS